MICGNCDGLGLLDERDEFGFGKPCPYCNGTGESLTEEGGVNESSSGVHGQQMSPLRSPENDRSGRASASTSPPAASDSSAWYHADFCHAYAWVYEDGDRLRVRWGERDGSNLSLHRRPDCDRCTELARGRNLARYGEFTMEKPSSEFSSLEAFFAVLVEIGKYVPGLNEEAAA